jgi:hypothetical protein
MRSFIILSPRQQLPESQLRTCSTDGIGVYTRLWRVIYEGNGPLGRPRDRLDDNIKMVLQEVGCEDAAD